MTSTTQEQLQATFPPAQRAALGRIILRARADLDYTLATIGTGAPSTIKRATAIQMALDGSDIAAIAQAVSLSESRVQQVIENVLASGLPALYPRFVEAAPLPENLSEGGLWKIIEPIILATPPRNKVRTSGWTPSLVLDFLIHNNTIQDASINQIEQVIKRYLDSNRNPPTFSYTDTTHEPDTRLGSYGTLFFFLVGLAMLAYGILAKEIPVLLFSFIWVPLSTLSLIKQILEWRLLRKVVAKKAKSSAAPAIAANKPPAKLNPLPPPPFSILHGLSLPSTPWKLETITDSANALGQPPLRILYLWVFASQSDQGCFETEGWPQLGSVHLLLNSTALSIGQLAGSTSHLLIDTQAKLDQTVLSYSDKADTYERPKLFVQGAIGKRPYRGYPIHTLVCNDAVWKPAVHQLAARCDLAVVNLSGYNPSHPGLEYEIHHLLSGGPPSKFLFLYERTTDADAVITSVLDMWSHLETPPAVTPELIFMRVPDSQEVGYAMQFRKGTFGLRWLMKINLSREGEYLPIAPRILAYFNRLEADRQVS